VDWIFPAHLDTTVTSSPIAIVGAQAVEFQVATADAVFLAPLEADGDQILVDAAPLRERRHCIANQSYPGGYVQAAVVVCLEGRLLRRVLCLPSGIGTGLPHSSLLRADD
jgi:hypothetical protein